MDEQLKGRLVSYLDNLDAKLKAGSDFVSSDTPLLVQEWLTWMFWENIAIAVVLLVIAIICSVAARWSVRRLHSEKDEIEKTGYGIGVIVAVLIGVHAIVFSGVFAMKGVKVHVAPRVVVVEKVSELTGLSKK